MFAYNNFTRKVSRRNKKEQNFKLNLFYNVELKSYSKIAGLILKIGDKTWPQPTSSD